MLLEVDVSDGINHKNLAILGNNALLGAGRPGLTGLRSRLAGGGGTAAAGAASGGSGLAGSAPALLSSLSTSHLFLHTSLLAVSGQLGALLIVGGGRSRSRGWGVVDARNVEVVSPSSIARELDVALDKVFLTLPGHVQSDVVEGTSSHEEDTEEHSAQARAVPIVIVIGALPCREAVLQEMVVAVAIGTADDVAHKTKAGLALGGNLDSGLDLLLGRSLGHIDAGGLLLLLLGLGALGDELLADFIRVEGAGDLAVGLGDLVNGSAVLDAEEVVEGLFGVGLVGLDLIADTENLTIYWVFTLAKAAQRRQDRMAMLLPSLLQAAARGETTKRPTDRMLLNFILSLPSPVEFYNGMGRRRAMAER